MSSAKRGQRISAVEVTNVTPQGVWLLVAGEEKFLPFELFPWFRDATISALMRVERPSAGHLYWPDLDVDLAEASIDNPEQFPLVSKELPVVRVRRTPLALRIADAKKASTRRLRS